MAEAQVAVAGPSAITFSGAAVDGAVAWALGGSLVAVTDPGGCGHPGPAGMLVTSRKNTATVYGTSHSALLALVGATAAILVLPYKDIGGVARKKTVKLVYFDQVPQDLGANAVDAGGKPARFAITGYWIWTNTDTYALMVLDATV